MYSIYGESTDLQDIDNVINDAWEYYDSRKLQQCASTLSRIGSQLDHFNNNNENDKDRSKLEHDQINFAATTIKKFIRN
eukprot:961165-Ditylum_brightwellii.AAC.1